MALTDAAQAQARVSVPSNNPFDPTYVVAAGGEADAVVGIFNQTTRGSGALLGDGTYVLTAAHVVFGEPVGAMQVAVDLPSGRQFLAVADVIIHPDYSPDASGYSSANDLALLRLAEPAPIAGFDIYRGQNEVGSVFTLTGYGLAGTGQGGTVTLAEDTGSGVTKRTGQNRYEAVDGL
ncbi:MAG: trypsin-like serine protease, partial [Pseudomonadota bacterium]